jgi:hypothetical protein
MIKENIMNMKSYKKKLMNIEKKKINIERKIDFLLE